MSEYTKVDIWEEMIANECEKGDSLEVVLRDGLRNINFEEEKHMNFKVVSVSPTVRVQAEKHGLGISRDKIGEISNDSVIFANITVSDFLNCLDYSKLPYSKEKYEKILNDKLDEEMVYNIISYRITS